MKAPVTKLVLILDESGSMEKCVPSMVDGFEKLREVVAPMEEGVTVDLWLFGTNDRCVAMDVKPSELKPLGAKDFNSYGWRCESDRGWSYDHSRGGSPPKIEYTDEVMVAAQPTYTYNNTNNGGGTALNMALIDAIDARLEAGLEMEAAVLVVLMTDGRNNVDHRNSDIPRKAEELNPLLFGNKAIEERLQLLRNSGQWTFVGYQPEIHGTRTLPGFTEVGKFQNTADGAKKVWDNLTDRIGDYLDARQGGEIPDHLL
jgi:hypothetical protein